MWSSLLFDQTLCPLNRFSLSLSFGLFSSLHYTLLFDETVCTYVLREYQSNRVPAEN